jgi:sn-1 stearoyl-lipid 9-desaturase
LAISTEPGIWNFAYLGAWFLGSYLYHGLGITLGYHRLLTHKSLRVPKWLMYVIVSGGYLCMMGSPIVWVGVHRLHHQKSDIEGDPHSPNDGFMHALVGWMTHAADYQTDEELQRSAHDLMQDPILRLFGTKHDAYTPRLLVTLNILFRLAILALFGVGPMICNTAAMVILFFSTQFVNAVCHLNTAGYRLHDTRENSRNVWWVAVLSLGEGWHNNHHAVPKSARHGMAWWEFDVTWYAILLLEKLGLSKEVVRPPANRMPGRNRQPVPVQQTVQMPEFDASMLAQQINSGINSGIEQINSGIESLSTTGTAKSLN